MNQTRVTLFVMADTRADALSLARAAIGCLYDDSRARCASGSNGYGTYRADIETITVPDDESESPQYATPMPCPGCKKLCDREGKCTNTGCAFGPDDETVIQPVDTRVSTR